MDGAWGHSEGHSWGQGHPRWQEDCQHDLLSDGKLSFGCAFLKSCTLQLAGLYFCVVKRIISEYVLNFRGTLSLSSLSARYDYLSETLQALDHNWVMIMQVKFFMVLTH